MDDEALNMLNLVINERISEITTDILEAEIDQLINEGLLKDIPILGIGYKLLSITQKISERFFAKKILRFLFQLKDVPKEKRERFVKELEDRGEKKRAGEVVITILNSLNDLRKATVVGNLLRATINNHITYFECIRLSHIVEKIFFDDLMVLRNSTHLQNVTFDIKVNLCQAGLLSQSIKDNRDWEEYQNSYFNSNKKIPPTFEYKINAFGLALFNYGF